MRLLFMHCSLNSSRKCWLFHGEQCIRALFMDPQIPLFNYFFIKNGSHGIIHTFKNYFTTVFLVSVFSFNKYKLNSNRPIECVFLFFLNSKTKYISQTLTNNHIIYKTYKSTMSDLNIKIVIANVIQYKVQAPFLGCSQLIWVKIRWDKNVRAR